MEHKKSIKLTSTMSTVHSQIISDISARNELAQYVYSLKVRNDKIEKKFAHILKDVDAWHDMVKAIELLETKYFGALSP